MQNKFWMVGLIVLGVSSPVSLADPTKAGSLTVGAVQGVVENRGDDVKPERAVEIRYQKLQVAKYENPDLTRISKFNFGGHIGSATGGGLSLSGGVFRAKANDCGLGTGTDVNLGLNYSSGEQLRPSNMGISFGGNIGYACNSAERFSLLGARVSLGANAYDPLVDSGSVNATAGVVGRSAFATEKVKGSLEMEAGWAISSGKFDHGKEVFIKGAADVNFTPGVAFGLYVSDRAMKNVEMGGEVGTVNRHAQEAGVRVGGSW